jgi:hypothetical protein
MAMSDFRIKVRLDIASDAEDTCEGCRWATPAKDPEYPAQHFCEFLCAGNPCTDDERGAGDGVAPWEAACTHHKPNLRARQVRALEGILAMMKRERVDRAGETLSRDVGASVAQAVADAKRAPGHLRGPFNDPNNP